MDNLRHQVNCGLYMCAIELKDKLDYRLRIAIREPLWNLMITLFEGLIEGLHAKS